MLNSEWASFSLHRKGLRVSSSPQVFQRSTYFLQLPYRFAIPLMFFICTTHWLCSQSMFLVGILVDGEQQVVTVGYSPLAIICLNGLCVAMILLAFVVGNRRLKTSIPSPGTCSAFISAMCHVSGDELGEEAAMLPVKWGVTSFDGVDQDGEAYGHCSISYRKVSMPEVGQLYAGFEVRA